MTRSFEAMIIPPDQDLETMGGEILKIPGTSDLGFGLWSRADSYTSYAV